jgi:hypothetical protein
MPKDKVKGTQKGREEALKGALAGLGMMVAAAGMPAQVRLSAREQVRRGRSNSQNLRGRDCRLLGC